MSRIKVNQYSAIPMPRHDPKPTHEYELPSLQLSPTNWSQFKISPFQNEGDQWRYGYFELVAKFHYDISKMK